MYNPQTNIFAFEELRHLFECSDGASTCHECPVRIESTELSCLVLHVLTKHPKIYGAMQRLQRKAVAESRNVRALKRKLSELKSSQVSSKRQRFSPMASTKSGGAPPFARAETNLLAEGRRLRLAGFSEVPEIAKSEHFKNLMAQFHFLDNCKCGCAFGGAVKVHLRHQVAEKRAELATLEDKLRAAENNLC